jgi:hypothetical protein
VKDRTPKDLEELYRQAKAARSYLEGVWAMNLAYYEGKQWLAWNQNRLYQPAMPKARITIVDNRITGCVRTEIAKMTKNRPVFVVTPRTADEQDTNSARLGEQVMRYMWSHLNMAPVAMKALEWSRICGAGFLKCYWDSGKGKQVQVLTGPQGNILRTQDGSLMRPEMMQGMPVLPGVQDQIRPKTIAQGDVCVEARSPFQMFVDPLCDTFEEAEWLIEETIKSASYIQSRYGITVEPDAPANPGLVKAMMGTGQGGTYKGVRVKEYWCKACADHPQGCHTVWIKDQILYVDEQPFDPMPYVMLSGIPVPGRLWPMSIVEMLRGPQTELNKVKSQIAENRNRVGNPTLVASKQAVQDQAAFKAAMTMPGGVHFFDETGSQAAIPQFLSPPPLPAYVTDDIQRIEESIQEISGQHEVSSAQVPAGVTAASAINLLMEADDTRLGPAVADYERNLGKLGQKILDNVASYYTDTRTIQIAGDNAAWQIFDFRGSMLHDNTHVEVQAGSAFPQSKAAKQAQIQDLLTFFVQSGNPPHGRQLAQFLQDSQIGGAERLVEEYTITENQCNRENVLLAQGRQLPINPYDDDGEHIANHEDFQRQPHYATLPPQIQAVFEQHVQAHRDREAQNQQAQLQQQMEMAGQGPQQQAGAAQQLQGAAAQQDQAQAQAQQALAGAQQQQGFQQAQAEQQQRHAEEQHQQRMSHQQQMHEMQMRRAQ